MNTSIARRRFKKACSKAAVSESLSRTFSPARPRACKDRLFTRERYIEGLSDARTQPGKGRVLARLGKGGCNEAFFNILLKVARHV